MKKLILIAVLFCTSGGSYAQTTTVDTLEISVIKYETEFIRREYQNWLDYTNKIFTRAESMILADNTSPSYMDVGIIIEKFWEFDSLKYNKVDANRARLKQMYNVAVSAKNSFATQKISKIMSSVDELKSLMIVFDAKVQKRLNEIQIFYMQQEVYYKGLDE